MKNNRLLLFLFCFAIFASCEKKTENTSETGTPVGAFTAARSGMFQKQNGYNAAGTAQLGTDEAQVQWLRLGSDFNASLSTGAVTVYLSKTQALNLNNTGDFKRLDLVKTPGEHFFKVEPAVDESFSFAILWCASASVQFGNAAMQ